MTNAEFQPIRKQFFDLYGERLYSYTDFTESTCEVCIPGIIQTGDVDICFKFLKFFPKPLELLTEEQEKRRQVPDGLIPLRKKWKTDTVKSLFKLWMKGDYTICPILADALQDAGCDCEPLLTELRKIPIYGSWTIAYFKTMKFCSLIEDSSIFETRHFRNWNAVMAMEKCSKKFSMGKIAKDSRLNDFDVMSSLAAYDRLTYATLAMYQHGLLTLGESVICGALAKIAQI